MLMWWMLACKSPSTPDPQPSADPVWHGDLVGDTTDLLPLWQRWQDRYLVVDGGALRVKTSVEADGDTVSEGQGYGLLLAVLMSDQDAAAHATFDRIWTFSDAHRSEVDARVFDWHVPADGSAEPGDDDSAFDGDADAALGLLMADAKWGSMGPIDYRTAALDVLDGLMASEMGQDSQWPLLGDWVRPDGSTYSQWTPRTSDGMPASFDAFGRATGDARWSDAADAWRDSALQLQDDWAPSTGLLPDFAVADVGGPLEPAPSQFLEAFSDGSYSYNACRDPWRMGWDALISGDARSAEATLRIVAWARDLTGGDPALFGAGYALDGSALHNTHYSTAAFLGPLLVGATQDPEGGAFRDALWDAVLQSDEGYYEDSLALLSLLTASGAAQLP